MVSGRWTLVKITRRLSKKQWLKCSLPEWLKDFVNTPAHQPASLLNASNQPAGLLATILIFSMLATILIPNLQPPSQPVSFLHARNQLARQSIWLGYVGLQPPASFRS